ncbi:hypothetical protein K1719_044030 [Acacia pycnantha]|nr:hypothetical protein K1719_044030 [Acacia pycnantha]
MAGDRKPKAVIVGGSIAGLSTAHALCSVGWDVVVLEKTTAPSAGSPTGAGLGLDSLSQRIIGSWLSQPQLLLDSTVPLTIDQNQVTDSEKKVNRTLTRDESFNIRAAHWVKAKVLKTGEIIEIVGNLLVAADGCLSSIRQRFLPDFKLRYSGYWAWRGVLDFSKAENSETITSIRKAYPDLGKCLYFDLGSGTHSVFYELLNKRLNWIWYVNQPEPEVQGTSVTMKVSRDMIQKMLQESQNVWIPELVNVMKKTEDPFLNFIYDSDPLEKIFWDNVVLVGDAAHPTTPHCLRSTNMSILDAAVLGKCIEKWGGGEKLRSALEEYESIRLPISSKQVLHARRLGRLKQGLVLPDREPFNPKSTRPEDCQELQQRNIPFFNHVPSILNSL